MTKSFHGDTRLLTPMSDVSAEYAAFAEAQGVSGNIKTRALNLMEHLTKSQGVLAHLISIPKTFYVVNFGPAAKKSVNEFLTQTYGDNYKLGALSSVASKIGWPSQNIYSPDVMFEGTEGLITQFNLDDGEAGLRALLAKAAGLDLGNIPEEKQAAFDQSVKSLARSLQRQAAKLTNEGP